MPLYDYVCMNDHESELLVARGELDALRRCPVCGGPATRRAFARIMQRMGLLRSDERLSTLHEATYEAEQAGLPRRLWHAARVRAEAQMQQGAQHWSPERPWDAKEYA